ncbi:MAG: hypothetical protein H6970_03635 [Gammaproteobacteria bacterium]|nr:hypothetical protein [Gammaproteobacteria bacterium]
MNTVTENDSTRFVVEYRLGARAEATGETQAESRGGGQRRRGRKTESADARPVTG